MTAGFQDDSAGWCAPARSGFQACRERAAVSSSMYQQVSNKSWLNDGPIRHCQRRLDLSKVQSQIGLIGDKQRKPPASMDHRAVVTAPEIVPDLLQAAPTIAAPGASRTVPAAKPLPATACRDRNWLTLMPNCRATARQMSSNRGLLGITSCCRNLRTRSEFTGCRCGDRALSCVTTAHNSPRRNGKLGSQKLAGVGGQRQMLQPRKMFQQLTAQAALVAAGGPELRLESG